MYIHPFALGIIATLLVECAILLVVAFCEGKKESKELEDEE